MLVMDQVSKVIYKIFFFNFNVNWFLLFQYNMEDTEEYQCATRLEKYFEKEIGKMGLSEQSSKPKRNRRTL